MIKKINKKWLKKHGACVSEAEMKEAEKIGDPIEVVKKLLSLKRLAHTNWLVTRLMNKKQCVQYAVYAAELVLPVWNNYDSKDKRPQKAIAAAKKYIQRQNSKNKLKAEAAEDDAREAACAAAGDARAVAYAAAHAANAAAYAAAYAAAEAIHAAYAAAYITTHKKIILNGIKILKKEK